MDTPAAAVAPLDLACGVAEQDEELEASLATTRQALEQALSAPSLPGIEALLFHTVVITNYFTNETLDRSAAAAWLRERARPEVRLRQLQRHQHVAVLAATTDGWELSALPSSSCLTFYLHRYSPAGTVDEEHGDWKIDVIAAE